MLGSWEGLIPWLAVEHEGMELAAEQPKTEDPAAPGPA